MKRILISIALFLSLIAILILVLFFLRNPQWEYVLEDVGDQNYTALLSDQNLEKDRYISTYEVDKITNRNEYVVVVLSENNKRAYLQADIGNTGDLRFPTIMPYSKVDIELSFESEKKNVLQEIICTYIHTSSSCKKTLTLQSWVMSNYKPF